MLPFLLSLLSKIPFASVFSFLPSLGSFIGPVVDNVKKYWRFYLPALLIALNMFTGYELHKTQASLTTERVAHAKDITDFRTAQAEADKKAQDDKATLTKESKANAQKADNQYSSLLAQYKSNLLRYQQANKGGAILPSYSGLPAPSGSDGPSAGAFVPPGGTLTISLDDANVCAVNTARLQAVHDWALNPPKVP